MFDRPSSLLLDFCARVTSRMRSWAENSRNRAAHGGVVSRRGHVSRAASAARRRPTLKRRKRSRRRRGHALRSLEVSPGLQQKGLAFSISLRKDPPRKSKERSKTSVWWVSLPSSCRRCFLFVSHNAKRAFRREPRPPPLSASLRLSLCLSLFRPRSFCSTHLHAVALAPRARSLTDRKDLAESTRSRKELLLLFPSSPPFRWPEANRVAAAAARSAPRCFFLRLFYAAVLKTSLSPYLWGD